MTKIIVVALKLIVNKKIIKKELIKKAKIKLNIGETNPFTYISTSCFTFLTKFADVLSIKNLYFFQNMPKNPC